MAIVLPVKVFTRDDPCTKVDIHNCFIGADGRYAPRPVVEARGVIGLNTPKYLIREGYAELVPGAKIDAYRLTADGVDWLTKGLTRHLELHPEDAVKVHGAQKKVATRRVARSRA